MQGGGLVAGSSAFLSSAQMLPLRRSWRLWARICSARVVGVSEPGGSAEMQLKDPLSQQPAAVQLGTWESRGVTVVVTVSHWAWPDFEEHH